MNRRDFVLAALAPANGGTYSPVQVQKLFFLIDREAAKLTGGPYFDFRPYHYGPFDKAVYKELEALRDEGLVDIGSRSYALTSTGQAQGMKFLDSLPKNGREYIIQVAAFVRRLSFSALVSAIYKEYPEMRANSVFQG
jgi:uncharacterized protein YwgA